MNFFDAKTPNETRTLTFDFGPDLPSGVTLSGIVAVSSTVYRGADPSPASVLNSTPQIVENSVLQSTKNGIAGADYLVSVLAQFSDGQLVELSGVLPVRATV